LMELFSTPGFDPVEFTRLQIEAFNRLYNNQIYEYYHSAGLGSRSKCLWQAYSLSYNGVQLYFKGFMLRPAVKFKPADGVTLSVGYEHYTVLRVSVRYH